MALAVRPARRISDTTPKSFGMYEKALALKASGADLIHLELGRPVTDTPEHIKQATIDALRAGHIHYSDLLGLETLRVALSRKIAAYNGYDVQPDQILVTNGLTHAAFITFMAILDPGDEIILLEPGYVQHVGKVELTGATVVYAPLDRDNGFAIRRDLIEPRITPRTRAIVVANPVNPTGRVFSKTELQIIADLAIQHDLLVVADEIYDQIIYGAPGHVSLASLPHMKERTISLYALTKTYAMDGWRVGYIAAPSWLMPGLLKVSANDVTHVNTFIQYGALAAVSGPPEAAGKMLAADKERRDLMVSRLNQMPGVTCATPEGAIYAFPDVSALGLPSQELAERILLETHVVVEAGAFYGPSGEGHLRMCFGSETAARIDEAMTRLSRFFNSL